MPDVESSLVGLRARNMREKQQRIFTAAARLFADRGFAAVSTSEIAKEADVAAGTVFRYAATKGELLLMVLNDELRRAIDIGVDRAASEVDTSSAIAAMIAPTLDYAREHPENFRAYQRELLFGDPGDTYRAEGLGLVLELETHIAERLIKDAKDTELQPDSDAALLVGNMIFGVAHLALARSSTGAHPGRDSEGDIGTQIDIATAGYLSRLSPITPMKGR